MLRSALLCILGVIIAMPLQAATECSEPEMQQDLQIAKKLHAKLLDAAVDEMDTSVSPGLQDQIVEMKDSLAQFISRYMACEASSRSDVKKIQRDLATYLDANKPHVNSPPPNPGLEEAERRVYGANLTIQVKRADAANDWIAIQVRFGIMCGEDSMLLIYAPREGEWRQILRWQSGKYRDISGAFGDFFEYIIVSKPLSNAPLVIVAHGRPWCTSGWSAFDLDALRVAEDANAPQIILHREESYNRTAEPAAVLRKTSYGFQLRVKNMSVAFEQLFIQPVIYSYAIDGDHLHRVQPVAVNGRNFVDVWLQSSWADASKWSAGNNTRSLRVEHAKFEALQGQGNVTFSFGPVRDCPANASRFQVELDPDSGAALYYQIREGQNSFTMLSVSATPDPKCDGIDLMKSH